MSNRADKLRLWNINPHCHWCGCLTVLTNHNTGGLEDSDATVDHLYSRFDPRRWVKRKPGEQHKVLACYKCNQQRSIDEHTKLAREEIRRRSQGYSIPLEKTFDSLEEVLLALDNHKVSVNVTS